MANAWILVNIFGCRWHDIGCAMAFRCCCLRWLQVLEQKVFFFSLFSSFVCYLHRFSMFSIICLCAWRKIEETVSRATYTYQQFSNIVCRWPQPHAPCDTLCLCAWARMSFIWLLVGTDWCARAGPNEAPWSEIDVIILGRLRGVARVGVCVCDIETSGAAMAHSTASLLLVVWSSKFIVTQRTECARIIATTNHFEFEKYIFSVNRMSLIASFNLTATGNTRMQR